MNNHSAWRHAVDGIPLYVEEINTSGNGDRYSYTRDNDKALRMTEQQCRAFCLYMRDCASVGFWC